MDPDFQREIVAKSKVKSLKSKVGVPVMYIVAKDAKRNELVVGIGEEAKSSSFEITETNWASLPHPGPLFGKEREVLVRIRHGGELIKGQLTRDKGQLKVILKKGVRGIASGQSAVFYREQGSEIRGQGTGIRDQGEFVMVGGGVIA